MSPKDKFLDLNSEDSKPDPEVLGWQVKGVKRALKQVESGDVCSHEEVFYTLREQLLRKESSCS